ncbi:TPM domain-containing protein [Butyrivibrio sp. X503]|uniref:TPM domain-containing protein n=1 Tax=Butyrivibrio sp. X503 TaxID=2364878 RepID=UPI000EA94D31|nr:TPM domain-containing protein [Butyrivibrio sp. X503]RKM54634.1 TPM domain-containing protein [Butyrivibrio sp. X503]
MKKNRLLKYITIAFSVVFLSLILQVPAQATSTDLWDSYNIPSTRQKPRLLDNADLLSPSEEKDILQKLDSLSETRKSNICILTTPSHTGPIEAFSDDYFDYNGFGADYNDSGVLFMLSMEDREWAISTSGDAIYAFTDYGQEEMMEQIFPSLKSGSYYDAFCKYIEVSDRYLDLYSKGTPYDIGYKPPKTIDDYIRFIIISLLIGLGVAVIPVGFMAAELKTVIRKPSANDYRSHDGLIVSRHNDVYMRSHVTRHMRNTDSGGGSGYRSSHHSGGSSIHHSSSGHSHGGSHGHF